jgi:TP901 family phage tail tape measure protein
MPGVLNLASAGAMDLATASDIASNILTGFGKEASEIDRVVDVMAKTFTSSNTNLMQLGHAMSFVAPVAKGFGFTIEETSAVIGMLSDAGIQASRAGTSLRRIITQLEEAGTSLGFSIYNANGQMLPMADILEKLTTSAGGASQAVELFGDRAGPGLIALIDQGADKIREFESALINSGGTAEQVAETQMQGLKGAFTELRSAIEGMFIELADLGILKKLENIVDKVADKIRAFTNASDETKESVLKLMAILAGLGPALMIVGTALGVIATAISVLGGPITAIIALVVALAGSLFYVLDNWNAVIERISDTNWWRNTLISMGQLIVKFNPFSLFVTAFNVLLRTFTGLFGDFFNWMVKSFLTVKAKVLNIVADIATKTAQAFSTIPFMEGASETVANLAKGLRFNAELAGKMADSGTDFAGEINDSLQDLEKNNPFATLANSMEDLKTDQSEYNHEFKTFTDYLTQAGQGMGNLLGLSGMFSGTAPTTPTDEGEGGGVDLVTDPAQVEQTLGFFGRIIQGAKDITSNTMIMTQAYKDLGDAIADAFTTAIMQGTSLLDQLASLGKAMLGKGIQMLLSFALGGGLTIGGKLTSGFLGEGGGLLGKIGGALFGGKTSVGDALITDSGKVVEFHPNDNILAMKDLGGLQTQGGTSNMNLGGEFRIKGTDLVLALSEANYSLGR